MKNFFKAIIIIIGLLSIINLNAQEGKNKVFSATQADLASGVTVKESTVSVDSKFAYRIFELNVDRSGSYFVSAWLMGAQTPKGNCMSYEVLVNDKKQAAKFTPIQSNWQSVYLKEEGKKEIIPIQLVKGYNKIVLVSELPEVPDVEFIKVSISATASRLNSVKYLDFIVNIKQEMYKNAAIQKVHKYTEDNDTIRTERQNTSPLPGSHKLNNPEGNYDHRANVPFAYTTYKTYHFNAGQQVFIATNAQTNYVHVLEMFSESNPLIYSWVNKSNSSNLASLNVRIPASGIYYIRVRAYIQNYSGVVDLNVNGQYYFRNCPVSGNGFSFRHTPNEELNYFTCNSIGDPYIWIEKNNGLPGTIVAFNDDYYNHGGEYNWGHNSRIKKQIGANLAAVLVSSCSSYNPTGNCDIYMGCKNSDVTRYFPSLRSDDAIQSAPADRRYNCTSWAGGITWGWFWGDINGQYYGNPQVWETWDKYFGNNPMRYIGATTYTAIGANADNGVIAMWALNGEITHGSVRGYANRHPHGYDWESKPGRLMRTFHPRDAVRGNSYGNIVRYYCNASREIYEQSSQPNGTINTSFSQNVYTFQQSIDAGLTVIENVSLDISQKNIIAARDKTSIINNLFDSWLREIGTDKYAYISNPYIMIGTQSGRALLNHAKNNLKEATLLFADIIFDNARKDDFVKNISYFMFCEIARDKYGNLIEQIKNDWKKQNYDENGSYIAPLPETFTKKYIKAILDIQSRNLISNTFLKQNNDNFEIVSVIPNPIVDKSNININLTEKSTVYISITNGISNLSITILKPTVLDKGTHSFAINANQLSNGISVCVVNINGNTYSRKILRQ